MAVAALGIRNAVPISLVQSQEVAVGPIASRNCDRNGPGPRLGCRAGAVPARALRLSAKSTLSEKVGPRRPTSSHPELWRGNPFAEFDADQVFHSPYHRAPAPQAISNEQKGKSGRNVQCADHLQRRPGLGLVTNETGDRAPVELNISRVQIALPKL